MWLLASPWFKYAALGAAVLALVVGGIAYHRHVQNQARQDGRNEVINDVQSTTIRTIEDARQNKEKTDAEIRSTPYDRRVDELQRK